MKNPSYEDVCTDRTGHAEVVQVTFDPNEISYEELSEVFWKVHDPSQLNRQGPDIGTQYRSVIFFHDKEQKEVATKSKKKLARTSKKKIVTEILPALEFYKAEEYHQKYLMKRELKVC